MKNNKILIVVLVAVGVVLLCCCALFMVAYIVGEKSSDEIDEFSNELENIESEIEDDITEETTDEDKPGDDGEQDPDAGDGTELVILENGLEYQIYSPKPNGLISSPLTVTGQVSGSWYFEGSFPIELRDYDGNVLATGIAQAQSDWMTEDLVEYEGTLTFTAPAGKTYGELFLLKDNPSGIPENDDQISYPVRFK